MGSKVAGSILTGDLCMIRLGLWICGQSVRSARGHVVKLQSAELRS